MDKWEVKYIKEAKDELKNLDNSIKKIVLAGIIKVSENPLPRPDGYGKPLGNKNANNLVGFFKIKYKKIGIRVVYTLVSEKKVMNIITISNRDENYCYNEAKRLKEKYGHDIFDALFG